VGVESYVPDEKSLRDALEQGGDGYRAGAARYAWWPSPSPQPPSSPALRERKGEYETSDGRYVARPSPPTLRERKGEYDLRTSTLRKRKGEYETDDQRSVVPYHPIHAAGEERGETSRVGRLCASVCQRCQDHDHPSPALRERGWG